MSKLISAYHASPTFANARKLRAYERAHQMAACLLSIEDQNLLATAIHHANTPQ